jgi:hypothetical protein
MTTPAVSGASGTSGTGSVELASNPPERPTRANLKRTGRSDKDKKNVDLPRQNVFDQFREFTADLAGIAQNVAAIGSAVATIIAVLALF